MCPENSAPEASSSTSESTESQTNQDVSQEEGAAPVEAAGELADLKDAAKDPSLSKEEKKEIQKQIKKFQLKIDGQTEDFEIDLSNEEELKKHLQLSKVAQKRMQSETQVRKAAEQLVEMMRTPDGLKKILRDPSINMDLKKFAADVLNEYAEEEQKSPEQREIEGLKKQLEERMAKEKQLEEDNKKSQFEKLQKDAEVNLENDITTALETSNLPKSPYTVKKMAEIMMVALENNMEITAKDAVSVLRKQMQEDLKQMFSVSNDDLLEELLGGEVLGRLQKRRVAKAKAAVQTPSDVKPTGKESEKKDETGKKINMRDFFGM